MTNEQEISAVTCQMIQYRVVQIGTLTVTLAENLSSQHICSLSVNRVEGFLAHHQSLKATVKSKFWKFIMALAKKTMLKSKRERFKAFMTEFHSMQHMEKIGYEIAWKPGPRHAETFLLKPVSDLSTQGPGEDLIL